MGRRNTATEVTQARIDVAKRRRDALELKLLGATYEQIASTLGYANRGNAFRDIEKAILDIPREAAEAVKQMELERLDRWLLALAPKLKAGSLDLGYLDRALKIQERRARYLGIDAPTRQVVTVITEDLIDAEIERLTQQVAERERSAAAEHANDAE